MSDLSEKRCLWLALVMIPGLGNIALKRLLERFREPEGIFKASLVELCEVEGIREEIARCIVKKRPSGDPDKELRKAEDHGARILTILILHIPGCSGRYMIRPWCYISRAGIFPITGPL